MTNKQLLDAQNEFETFVATNTGAKQTKKLTAAAKKLQAHLVEIETYMFSIARQLELGGHKEQAVNAYESSVKWKKRIQELQKFM